MDRFLLADDRDILKDAGRISMEIAKSHAESEFEKYRIVQDHLYVSDFDKLELDAQKPDLLSNPVQAGECIIHLRLRFNKENRIRLSVYS